MKRSVMEQLDVDSNMFGGEYVVKDVKAHLNAMVAYCSRPAEPPPVRNDMAGGSYFEDRRTTSLLPDEPLDDDHGGYDSRPPNQVVVALTTPDQHYRKPTKETYARLCALAAKKGLRPVSKKPYRTARAYYIMAVPNV